MKVYKPVEDGRYGKTGRVYVTARGQLIQVAHGGIDPVTEVLPPTIRLCELVNQTDAPTPAGVPDEVREAYEAGMRTEREHQNALSRFVEQKHQEELAAAEGMPNDVPNWDHAPNWARYWTRDLDGRGMWWETEPSHSEVYGFWMNEGDSKRTRATNKPTLRPRPATGGDK